MANQLRRAKNLVQSSFRAPSPPAETPAAGKPVTLGKAEDLSVGTMTAYDVEGGPVAVANVGGTFYAFHDTCTHRKCPLSDGELQGTAVQCICHGSRFDITDGSVLKGPADRPVRSFPVTVVGGDLTIEI